MSAPFDSVLTDEQEGLYEIRFGGATTGKVLRTLQQWDLDGGCEAACEHECWVEPDGTCEHGKESWLRVLDLI